MEKLVFTQKQIISTANGMWNTHLLVEIHNMHDSHVKVLDSSFGKISKTNTASDLENSEQIP